MCGIVGCASNPPALLPGRAIAMRDTMTYRGPDDAGLWSTENGQVVLGNRRLAILDLSPSGHQPMQDEAGNATIVFNGEIYNFVELREELKAKGCRFRSSSDTEVLLAAYDAWGTECLSRLNGMFGFAIWDERRRQLFAARDRFGEKPFYYFHNRGVFLFASEIKALLASQLIEPRPNNRAICRYLLYHESDRGTETPLEGIHALPPAHGLLYSPHGDTLKTWQYWDLDPHVEIRLPSDEAYGERFLELLKDSVRIRLRSDVPVGSSLSGGLDSSTIVALVACESNGNRQTTFSARFKDPLVDEGPYIDCLTQHFALESHHVYPSPQSLLEEIDDFTWHQEHPFSDTSVYAQWTVMRLAKEQGVTVLLDGQGGDEVLGGYASYRASYYRDLLRGLHWGQFLAALSGQVRLQGPALLPATLAPLLPDRVSQPLRRFLRPPGISADFERRWISPPTRIPARFPSALHADLYQTLRCTVLPLLLRFADRNSMAFSREVRLPFLDPRVVEFLFAIPEDQKIRGAVTKVILRRALRGLVPDKILRRTDKVGYETPQAEWLRGPLRGWADDVIHSQAFREREWIDAKRIEGVWKSFLTGQAKYHKQLWLWLWLEAWAGIFLCHDRVYRPQEAHQAS